MRTTIVVLGDLGRSPRMQYHALASAAHGEVDLIGLEGAPPLPEVANHPRVRVHRLPDRSFGRRHEGGTSRYVWMSAARAAAHASRLLSVLLRVPRPDLVLVQSPPAVPTHAVSWVAARLRGSRLVVDWHNLAHTLLAVRLGDRHRAVRAVARSERRWARRADGHLAVSAALASWLRREWRVAATVVYDRPRAALDRPSLAVADALWARLARDLALGPDRLPLVVCPTSWTLDEDFDLLLEALERAERGLSGRAGQAGPALALLLTGRGAMRSDFEKRLARRTFRHIAVRTLWLEPEDYPALVGMADAGLCLHQSASGLDLPMKLADFRGAGIPACAYDYAPVLGEVLTPGREGVTFRDPGELSTILRAFCDRDDSSVPRLAEARAWLAAHPAERWEPQWAETARPVLFPEASSASGA
jgi:beta-1,4-mannosyltransferase